MKPGDLVQIRIPNGWVDHDGVDGQLCLLIEIRPVDHSPRPDLDRDYIVLLNGSHRSVEQRLLDRVCG